MSETNCKSIENFDYDKISKSMLIRKICEINDIFLSPKAFNRIMEIIQNMPSYDEHR